MSMEYIRRTYDVPAKRGGTVMRASTGEPIFGVIVGSRNQYLRIRWEGDKWPRLYHPTDDEIVYFEGGK